MSSKMSKKGRNPGAVDNWLDTLGYYRKNVAYDETCLFRAVAEQLFDCQVYHERVRKECISYARKNLESFSNLYKSKEEFLNHLGRLEKHMVVSGNIELDIISFKYRRNIIIFDAVKQEVNTASKTFSDSIFLCLMGEDHYDAVYEKEHIVTAGFCQSIIYKILYENVYDIQNVDSIVHGMLYDKTYITTQADLLLEDCKTPTEGKQNNIESIDEVPHQTKSMTIAPFPFKVAKALDPTIYRNIEYDSWTEIRRELRLGDWYYGDDKLISGTRCILNVNDSNEKLDCVIQDVLDERQKCIVYILKLAEKRIVNYADLSPEDGAKPWPLPYRFSKHLVLSSTCNSPIPDKTLKLPKKRKDKKRSKSCSESSVLSNGAGQSNNTENDVFAYVGVPLQMQERDTSDNVSGDSGTNFREEPNYSWDSQYCPNYISTTASWPVTPVTPQGMLTFPKPVLTSLPSTSTIVPYQATSCPYVYNCSDQGAYQMSPPVSVSNSPYYETVNNTENPGDLTTEVEKCNYINCNNEEISNHNSGVTLTPVTPHPIGMYPQVPAIPYHPGTPIIYSPDVGSVLIPPPAVPVYTYPVEYPYGYQSESSMYPPTPQSHLWYPGNPQGFIFPNPTYSTAPSH